MNKEERIKEINRKISEVLKDAEYDRNFDDKKDTNDKLLDLAIEWEQLTGEKRPGADKLVGYYSRSKFG